MAIDIQVHCLSKGCFKRAAKKQQKKPVSKKAAEVKRQQIETNILDILTRNLNRGRMHCLFKQPTSRTCKP